MRQSQRETLAATLFLFPNILGFLIFILGPAIFSIAMGFTDWTGLTSAEWIGINNYVQLLNDKVFLKSLRNTVVYTLEFTPLVILASLALALFFNRKLWGINIFRVLCFLPIVTDFISVAIAWSWIYHFRFGILNHILGFFGISRIAWLGDADFAMIAIVLMSVWRWMGYYAVILLAALQSIPEDLREAATIDGASKWQVFTRITIPLLSPALFFVLIMSITSSFAVFEQMYIMTNGGPKDSTISITMYLYQQGFRFFQMGYASAIAWVLFFITFIVTAFNWWVRKHWVFEDS